MSQSIFRNPIVSSAPVRTGTGTGTVTIDRLTHFTVAQTYTLTCIAKSPDCLFTVSGSLDGSVGIATVGTQFFDQDLKVFLTIQQGSTAFEVGDQFVFTVSNGTDLNQQNIDQYDELPQKNFGPGVTGTEAGDDNIRYSDLAVAASRTIEDLKFTAVATGPTGDLVTIQYLDKALPVAAALTLQDLTYTAVTPGAAGNSITVLYNQFTPAAKALILIQNVQFQAILGGTAGNSITIAYTTGAVAGAEVVTVVGNAISVQIQSGVSTALQIVTKVNATPAAAALIGAAVRPNSGSNGTAQTGPVSPTNLAGGAAAIGSAGSEVVSVTGSAISVTLQSGVSTATQVRAAILASSPATALVSVAVTGTGSNPQTSTVSPAPLAGGSDTLGAAGSEVVSVSGNAISVRLENNVSTATQVRTAILASAPASALVSVAVAGTGSKPQHSPRAAEALYGGRDKVFSFNHDEISDSGHFFEGNAGIRAKDIVASDDLDVAGQTTLAGVLTLNDADSNDNSGQAVTNAQKLLNELIQNDKLSIRTADYSTITWSSAQVSFAANIVINFPDTGFTNVISTASSPFGLTDGQSMYVTLNRAVNGAVLTPFASSTIPKFSDTFRIASRFGLNLLMWDNTLIRDGRSAHPGEGGSGGDIHVQLYDPSDTTLPSGASATIDAISVTNGMTVLFTGLGSGNNRVYKASGVGSSIVWTLQNVFANGAAPSIGEAVIVEQGQSYGLQRGVYDSSTFEFNLVTRYFTGTSYWEMTGLKTSTLADNSTGDVFTMNVSGSENTIVDFSILRGSTKETGSLYITSDGTSAAVAQGGAYIGVSGVNFTATVSAGVLHLVFATTSTGAPATMKYFLRRWSDAVGGPGGVPSYSGATLPTGGAAGASKQIQYNSSGALAADSTFTWDASTKVLQLNGLEVVGLSAPITLADNQSVAATMLSYVAATYPFVFIDYSIVRDGVYRCGTLQIANDGTGVAMGDMSSSTGSAGITLSATISGGNVLIQYTSTNLGLSGTAKVSIRRWA